MEQIHLGTLAHVRGNPFEDHQALEILEDGALWVGEDGRIKAVGQRRDLLAKSPLVPRLDHRPGWLLPGLVDGHIHFPQLFATAAPGTQLLDWLNRSVFPRELEMEDQAFAAKAAKHFVDRLLAHGTTTAMVFGSQFPAATDGLFQAAHDRGLRLISGLTLMDRDAPEPLFTPADVAFGQSETLIERWRGNPRLHYAITPRFALSCSHALLEVCRALVSAHPQAYVQTHINENHGEVEAVGARFSHCAHYAAVYDRYGLLTPQTVLAHSIHTTKAELQLFKARQSAVCHCPDSNLYLGSGLFPLQRHLAMDIPVLMGTDVGAGTRFSILAELAQAYKVQQLNGFSLSAGQLLFLGTLAGAQALRLDDTIGNFQNRKDADFLVLATGRDDFLQQRLQRCRDPEEQLFVLIHTLSEPSVIQTFIGGRPAAKNGPGGN